MMRFELGVVFLALSFVGLSESAECQICGCSNCPADWKISNPNAIIVIPEEFKPLLPASIAEIGTASCALIDMAGSNGLIPTEYCNDELRLQTEFREICGCPSVEQLAAQTVPAPAEAPVVPPTTSSPSAALVFDDTIMPTAGPNLSPSAATAAPVVAASESPSTSPIVATTGTPVATASESPSTSPIVATTGTPVATASESPSSSPIVATTGTPVATVSESPSTSPIVATTATPVATASKSPSSSPIVATTGTPVANASETPSKAPVIATTGMPSAVPSAEPSKSQVVSAVPSVSPSVSAVISATGSPVAVASGTPSQSPVTAVRTTPTSDVPSDAPSDAPSDTPSDIPSQAPGFFAEATIFARLENITTSFTETEQLSFAAATRSFLTDVIDTARDFVVTVMSTAAVTRRRSRRLENGNMELGVSVKASTLASDECFSEAVLDALDSTAFFVEVQSSFVDISGINVAADADVPTSSGKGKGKKKGRKSKKGACASRKGKGGKSGSGKSGKGARNLTQESIHTRN